jgi:ActR/RegA family two-component response regulator
MPDNSNQTPPRILIVDNEKRTVTLYSRLAKVWGYAPIIAEGVGEALIEDAKTKAKEFRCQMALVDMRLIDDQDEEDTSGLELIKEIKPAETIIVSGYGTLKLAVETVKNRGAADFFEKNDNPGSLKEKVDGLAARTCAAHKSQSIGPPEILLSATQTLFDPAKHIPLEAQDQILDMLARLFPDADSLRLEKMSSSIVSSDFSTAPRPRSVVLRVYEDELQPVIVKIARTEKIIKEVARFNKYIRGRLVGKHNPVLEEHVELWDIGGIKLSYVGSIEETFANFVSAQPIEKIEQSLGHFFLQTWSDHYKKATDRPNSSLFKLYCEVWDRDWVNRAYNYTLPDASTLMPPHLWQMARNRNPLDWLKLIAENEGGEHDPSMVKETRTAITHGDLHADNLLIDDTQHGWVVDFERSGEGHALQDFIELEADIITRIACARENFPAFYHFCMAIVSTDSLKEAPSENLLLADNETRKLLATISTIRSLAVQCTSITDFRQYLLGLYFNTIFRATIALREQQIKDLRVWMLASILCHRLSHWNQPWPPEEWKKAA